MNVLKLTIRMQKHEVASYLLLQSLFQRLILHLLLPQTGGQRDVLWACLCTHLSDLLIGPERYVEWGKLTEVLYKSIQNLESIYRKIDFLLISTYVSNFSSAWSLSVWYLCSSCLTLARYSWAHFFSTSSFCMRKQRTTTMLYIYDLFTERKQMQHCLSLYLSYQTKYTL